MTGFEALIGLRMSAGKTGEVMFNLKTGKPYTINELFAVIEEELYTLDTIKNKEIDMGHLMRLYRCCGFEDALETYNNVLAHKKITKCEFQQVIELFERSKNND